MSVIVMSIYKSDRVSIDNNKKQEPHTHAILKYTLPPSSSEYSPIYNDRTVLHTHYVQ